MPTERFYHLPEAKKKIIREAAIEEFTKVPFEKVSINKIIQSAGISRGSFYTYFEDKRDVLRYIFSDTADRLKTSWTESLRKYEGDIWKSSEELLESGIHFAGNQINNMFQMAQNIMVVQDFDQLFWEEQGKQWIDEKKEDEILIAVYELADKSMFKETDIGQFRILITMIMGCVAQGISWYYRHMDEEEKIKKLFRKKLEILQYGICKQ